jgi:hypothetical protein
MICPCGSCIRWNNHWTCIHKQCIQFLHNQRSISNIDFWATLILPSMFQRERRWWQSRPRPCIELEVLRLLYMNHHETRWRIRSTTRWLRCLRWRPGLMMRVSISLESRNEGGWGWWWWWQTGRNNSDKIPRGRAVRT